MALLLVPACRWVQAAEDRTANPVEQVRLPLFRNVQEEFSGAAGRDLRLPLPHSIALHSGAELNLMLRPLAGPPVQPVALAVAWNGRLLLVTNLIDRSAAPLAVRAPVPLQVLSKGDNVIALRLLQLGTTNMPMTEVDGARWLLLRPECFVSLNFSRAPLFEELARFPHTLAEDKLLQPDPDPGTTAPSIPVLSLILPGICGRAQLHVAAAAAARLGQLEYLHENDCRLVALEAWKSESLQRDALLIARRDQLGGIEIPPPLGSALAALSPGQGLLGEFFVGNEPREHRVLLAAAADDAGLDKVALTLGSSPAMNSLAHSPAVIERAPILVAAPASDRMDPPHAIQGLYQIQEFLLTDPYARAALYVVPSGPSLEQVRTLFGLWMKLGRSLPASPVLWPDVATYQAGVPFDAARVQGRNILALGALPQWTEILPPETPPALRLASPEAPTLLVQGRRQNRSELDPTLAFAQLLPSPWSATNVMILAGGWRDYAIPATSRLLIDPSSPALLAGNVAAMDELGRAAAYDLRQVGSESFAERLRRTIPPGLTAQETAQRLARYEGRMARAHQWNARLSAICGVACFLLVSLRLVLMGQQARLRKAALAAERARGLSK